MRALRVIVAEVKDCYAALAWVHQQFAPIAEEFDDYIARPKPNGYQSLHTVVRDGDGTGRPIEMQIRTHAMHDHAEHGVAAHWGYKEAGRKGYAGVCGQRRVRRQDRRAAATAGLGARPRAARGQGLFDDRIYVLTPEAAIIELPQGATPVDFAYTVHTSLGHRCRGARVDGAMVPLNTPLQNGQTVEIIAAKEGGPSRDWLNAELGFLASHARKAKVRAWFNEQTRTRPSRAAARRWKSCCSAKARRRSSWRTWRAAGLQVGRGPVRGGRQGRILAAQHRDAAASAGAAAGAGRVPAAEEAARHAEQARQGRRAGGRRRFADDAAGQVLQAGAAGRHRRLRHPRQGREHPPPRLQQLPPDGGARAERVIEVEWGAPKRDGAAVYPVDVAVEAADRQGLLRDISEVFAKEKMNVIGVHTQSVKGTAWMTFTVEIADSARLTQVLRLVAEVPGVRWRERRLQEVRSQPCYNHASRIRTQARSSAG